MHFNIKVVVGEKDWFFSESESFLSHHITSKVGEILCCVSSPLQLKYLSSGIKGDIKCIIMTDKVHKYDYPACTFCKKTRHQEKTKSKKELKIQEFFKSVSDQFSVCRAHFSSYSAVSLLWDKNCSKVWLCCSWYLRTVFLAVGKAVAATDCGWDDGHALWCSQP